MNLQIKKFDPKTIDDNRVCVFIGKRGTGKTTLVTDVLYTKRHMPVGIVMSGTEEGNSYYQNYVPDLFIYNAYSSDVMNRVIQRQKKLVKKKQPNSSVFVLVDDCMYDKKMIRDTCIRGIFMNGRHWNIFFMLTMQYCMDLSPDLRANIDYVFILRENIIQNREKIWKNFFGIFPTFDMFSQVLNNCTEDYECLVLDNTSKSNKIEDVVFWYKAKMRPEGSFKIGSPQFWKSHKTNYNPKYDDDDTVAPRFDTSKMKKNSIPINVKKGK
jgi:hypothetical protein